MKDIILLTFLFFIGFLFVSNPIFANNKSAEIDSLKYVLSSTSTDTTKIIILNQLAWAYVKINKDSSVFMQMRP